MNHSPQPIIFSGSARYHAGAPAAAMARLLVVFALCTSIFGCGGGPKGGTAPAPNNLSYASPVQAVVGTAITLSPTVTGTISGYAVSPDLPAGLSIATNTGVISGTPTVAAAQATYTVTASNTGGPTSFGLVLSVIPPPPSGLTYPSPVQAVVGTAIGALSPTVTGTVTAYSVSPDLPAGLSIAASTGVISGTPTAAAAQATYTVTATNAGSAISFGLVLSVNPAPPAPPGALSYPSPVKAVVGTALSALSPTVTGTVTAYSVSPDLPAGLSIAASTGVISGIPTAVTAQATYTVTATNVTGASSFGLVLSVNIAPPGALSYPSPVQATVGVGIATLNPAVVGPVTSYSVSPALPAGLAIDTTRGAIAGTPTAATAKATYTVTATNAGGSATFGLVLTVNPAAPRGLSYPSPVVVRVDKPMAALRPTVTGEALTYSVSPDLPAGLSLNTATGAISGTPTAATAKANYTLTAENVSGSTTFSLELTIRPPAVIAVGTFRDATVAGLGYSSGEQNGVTDSKGKFNYEVGESVTFAVGNVTLGTAAQGKELITPVDIVPNGTGTSRHVLNIVRFLLMLDRDGEPDNGIEISEAIRTAAADWSAVDFATPNLPDELAQIIAAAQAADGGSHALPSLGEAKGHLSETFFCTHSGLYLGTTTWDAPSPGTSPFALVADADQSGVGYYRYDAAGDYINFLGGGGSGYDESLDGSFTSVLEHGPALSISLIGTWLDINHVNGSWQARPAAIGGPEGGTFEVAR
ncbi:MAG TPA: Ig domain-containing protein, partial [Povalibacter sp.]